MASLGANEKEEEVAKNGEDEGKVNGGEVGTKTPPAAPASPPLSTADAQASTEKRLPNFPFFFHDLLRFATWAQGGVNSGP